MDFKTLFELMRKANMPPQADICANEAARLKKLQKPAGRVDVVMDTDACNEVDDQFAIAYALKRADRVNLQALYAAPFCHMHAETADKGMELSYDEILKVLDLAGRAEMKERVYLGSRHFLPDENTPVRSPAAEDLIARGMARDPEDPLYVLAIGAITNVASALLLEPRLRDHLVVIWHGGTALDWPACISFNACQDIAATRVVMGSGVPFVMQPGAGVAYSLTTSVQEMEYWLKGKNPLCDYLVKIYQEVAGKWHKTPVWSHPLVDVAAVSWLLDDAPYMNDRLTPTPLISYTGHYEFDPRRPLMRYVYFMNRDAILSDLFTRISQ